MKFNNIKDIIDWNIYWILFMMAEFSLLAALPYSITMSGDALYDLAGFIPGILAAQFARSTAVFLIGIFIGLFLGKKIGLGTPVLSSVFEDRKLPADLNSSLKLSILAGLLIAAITCITDKAIFSTFDDPLLEYLTTPPLWERILYSFHVGITEEIVLRFFLVTLLMWLTWKIKKDDEGKPTVIGAWLSIIVISLVYALLYLFFARESMAQTTIARIMIINGLAGIVFGWLYWKKGLEYSIIANLVASLMIFVVLGSLLY